MSNDTVTPIIELLVQELTTQVTEQLMKQIPIYAQSDFLAPNSDEVIQLLENDDNYQEYSLALAWIQDILLNDVDKGIKPNLSPEEAKHRYFEVLRQAENEILAENLSINYATAIRLSQAAQSDKELGSRLIATFLDDIADWLNHFSETIRTGDETIIQNYVRKTTNTYESPSIMSQIINDSVTMVVNELPAIHEDITVEAESMSIKFKAKGKAKRPNKR
jgi:hypothetical protein